MPVALRRAVRALTTDDDLDELAPHLPSDAAEMLYLLAAGYDLLDAKLDSLLGAVRSSRASGGSASQLAPRAVGGSRIAPMG